MDWIDGERQTTTSYWQHQLGIDWTRVSCRITLRNTPLKCVTDVKNNPTPGIQKYFLYLESNSPTLAADAQAYSALTLTVPSIDSVGFDDFFSYYEPLYDRLGSGAVQALNTVIDNLKSVNPRLKFGITLYENELDPQHNPYINATRLPPAVKAKFDYIHLFLHYRANASKFAQYVEQAKADFPNAEIIAGVYAYDRIDYFPCAQGDAAKTPCTEAQEIAYFNQTLLIQEQLLLSHQVVGLEIFPGYFGAETNLYGPGSNSDNLTCHDISRCIRTTLAMRDSLTTIYRAFQANAPALLPGVSAPAVPAVQVSPNPWRRDKHAALPIRFSPISSGSTLRIYSVSSHLVRTLGASGAGALDWDLRNERGEHVASGLYLYNLTNAQGQSAQGKFAIID